MSEQDKQSPKQRHDFDEPIAAIDFTPVDGPLQKRRFRPTPAQWLISSLLLLFLGAAWFVLSARSVFIDVTPYDSEVSLQGGLALRIGPRYLVRPGEVRLQLSAPGYYSYDEPLLITGQSDQTYRFELMPLPGYLSLTSEPEPGATVYIDGEEVGVTPLDGVEVAAGEHTLGLRMERYQSLTTTVDIAGREQAQSLHLSLEPDWAMIELNSEPAGATVFVDEEEVGVTPLNTEVLSGNRQLRLKLPAHKSWTQRLSVVAGEDQRLPTVTLEPADGLVFLRSTPDNAGVLLNGEYQGQTPLEISVTPQQSHELTFFRNGFQRTTRSLQIAADEEATLSVTLPPITSSVRISATPEDAQLYVDGRLLGEANQTIELLAASQTIEIRREGYVPFETDFVSRPGLEQRLNVTLISEEQQRLDSIEPIITTASGQRLRLLYPASFTMGSSRREAGRQANEIMRDVKLTRPFYIAEREVTNAQFRRFRSQHSSGVVQSQTLDNDNQPVVRVSWEDAALYTNWLSEQEGLDPFYTVDNGSITGFNPESTGYRLPTEAEWAWSARVEGDPNNPLRFPWGYDMPPPEKHGNYADLSAANLLARIISNYDDGFAVSAPVGSFAPNAHGLYDLGGNVSEWVHDYYGTTGQLGNRVDENPMGPETGNFRVIRGASWAHGSITELRLSFRDYGDKPRDDVGFRIARFLE